jgi:hypothetical protein
MEIKLAHCSVSYSKLESVRCIFDCEILSQVAAVCRVRSSGNVFVILENVSAPERMFENKVTF